MCHITAMAAAYETGRVQAFSPDQKYNPYSYSVQKTLYWEFERGYRDCLYGTGK